MKFLFGSRFDSIYLEIFLKFSERSKVCFYLGSWQNQSFDKDFFSREYNPVLNKYVSK